MRKYGSDQTQKITDPDETGEGQRRTGSLRGQPFRLTDQTQDMERDDLGMVARGEDD